MYKREYAELYMKFFFLTSVTNKRSISFPYLCYSDDTCVVLKIKLDFQWKRKKNKNHKNDLRGLQKPKHTSDKI